MEALRKFVFMYIFIFIVLSGFGLIQYVQVIPTLDITSTNLSAIPKIINFAISIINVVINFISFSIEGIEFLNLIFWAFRFIIVLDLLIYLKRLFNPVAN